jgi:hypothetical protein
MAVVAAGEHQPSSLSRGHVLTFVIEFEMGHASDHKSTPAWLSAMLKVTIPFYNTQM